MATVTIISVPLLWPLQALLGFEALPGVAAVHLAVTVVCPREVVQEHCSPEACRFVMVPRRTQQAERVHHHACNMSLPVDGALMNEMLREREQLGEGELEGCRYERHGHAISIPDGRRTIHVRGVTSPVTTLLHTARASSPSLQ